MALGFGGVSILCRSLRSGFHLPTELCSLLSLWTAEFGTETKYPVVCTAAALRHLSALPQGYFVFSEAV